MLTLYCWRTTDKTGHWLDADALRVKADELRGGGVMLWVDLEDPTPEEEQLVYEQFHPVHPLSREDITRLRREPDKTPHFPKVEEFEDYLFVVINPLTQGLLSAIREPPGGDGEPDRRMTTQLSAVLTHHQLITHHYEPLPGISGLRTFLAKHPGQAQRGPDYLFHLILDAAVDQYVQVLDHFGNSLDDIELRVFNQPRPALLRWLLRLKRQIITLRKTLVYEREVLARLSRGEFALIDERETVYYRNVYDHLVRFTELMESSREMVTDLMQTHLAAASNRLNEIMKVLTMISCSVLPMTLIAGIYGMNFELLPEKNWRLGYPFALGLMLLTGLASVLFFRWKKWL